MQSHRSSQRSPSEHPEHQATALPRWSWEPRLTFSHTLGQTWSGRRVSADHHPPRQGHGEPAKLAGSAMAKATLNHRQLQPVTHSSATLPISRLVAQEFVINFPYVARPGPGR